MRPRRPARRAPGLARRAALAGLVLAAGTTLAADPAGAAGTKAPPKSAKLVPLVVYTNGGMSAAAVSLYRKVTGNYPISIVRGTAGQLAKEVEADRGKPHWDVLWTVGDEAVAQLDRKGLLLRSWEPPAIKFNAVAKRVVPKDGAYVPVGVTVAGALAYSTHQVKAPPTSWNQLLGRQYKGAVGMVDPSASPQAYPLVAGIAQHLGGVAQGEAFYDRLKSNGLHVYRNDQAALSALAKGKIKVAAVASSAGVAATLKPAHGIKVAYLRPETVVPEVVAINGRLSPTVEKWARWFTELMFSELGQNSLLTSDEKGTSLVWPVLAGERGLPSLPPLASVPTQVINADTWGKRQSAIETWFSRHIAG